MNEQEPRSKPKVRRSAVLRWLVLVCVVLVLIEWIVHRHAIYPWESWPGFYALFGFVALGGIVLLGKQLRRFIRRDEDYYDE
ncbi:MAG: hypothetical protein VYB37_03090 [Pseudomonadota bacterium]|jgi:hypothetical protein|nr:hypothetical protein [Pseudomonadota bacterium]